MGNIERGEKVEIFYSRRIIGVIVSLIKMLERYPQYMSIRPNASLTEIGLAAPAATVFEIALCLTYYKKRRKN